MNKSAKILILGAAVVVFVLLLYFFGGRFGEPEYVTDDWTETYDPADKGPYGTYMLKELLDTVGMFGNFLEMNVDPEEALEDDPDQNDIYFFIGRYNYVDYETTDYLYEFVAAGNTVFMACDDFPYEFMSRITRDADSTLIFFLPSDSVQIFRFLHPDLRSESFTSTYIYNNKGTMREWSYLNPDIYDLYGDDTISVLGESSNSQTNFLKIYYGEGLIYLHSTPYQFTNISMMKQSGFEYVEKVLQHIPPGRVQWDRYNLDSHWLDDNGDGGDKDGGGEKRQSIIQFILSNPPLAWAFFILLAGALLYALFKGKRMQKIIPATEAKDNTSLEYINTLASLYLQEKKHQKLIRLKEKTFLNFIADHYFISTKEADARFISKVAVKSQIPEEKIKEIFDLFRSYESYEVLNDDQLILLHQKIEYFYKNCR